MESNGDKGESERQVHRYIQTERYTEAKGWLGGSILQRKLFPTLCLQVLDGEDCADMAPFLQKLRKGYMTQD